MNDGAARIAAWSRRAVAAVGLLLSGMSSASAVGDGPPVADTIEQRMQACVGCHGPRGGGVAGTLFPRLAGQPAAYLAAQMKAFRDGVRTYAPMNYLMSRQSDVYFAEIAEYFATQTPDPRVVEARLLVAADPVALESGRALVRDGRPAASLPACTACHGDRLSGTLPGIPALAGLPRDYLVEQVGSWKSGAHRSPAPNCMAEVARRMSGADIVAAATWLSLQRPDGPPQARSGPLPLACGGE